MELTVAVATFGGDGWTRLAEERALLSCERLGLPAVYVHQPDGTCSTARNAALAQVETDWVVHLDADDELEGGFDTYLDRQQALRPYADVLVPEIRYVHPDGAPGLSHWPRVAGHHDHGVRRGDEPDPGCSTGCIPYGNWVHIGAAVRTDLARRVGWEEWERYEDWAFWLGCYNLGASFVRAPGAVYRAHVRAGSRNGRGVSSIDIHRAIAAAHGAPIPA